MFSYYYVPTIRLVGTNVNKMVRLLRYSGLSSQNMYIKKNCAKRFCLPNQAQMHADSILKIRKNKTCLTVKEARFLEGIRTERAS